MKFIIRKASLRNDDYQVIARLPEGNRSMFKGSKKDCQKWKLNLKTEKISSGVK